MVSGWIKPYVTRTFFASARLASFVEKRSVKRATLRIVSMDKPTLLFVAASSLSLYIPISRGQPRRLCGMPLDRRIPFLPLFVMPYLSLFLFFPAALILLYPTPFAREFFIALFVVGILYAAVSPLVGCGAQRADAEGPGVLRWLVRFVYRLDGAANNDVFPSTHVYLSTICGYYLISAFPSYALLTGVVAGLIAVSTIFIKQHNAMDIAGGVLWASTAILAATFIAPLFT